MKLKKRFALLAVPLLLSSMLAGCGGNNNNNAAATDSATNTPSETKPAATTSAEPVTLRIAWWGGDTRHSYTQQVIDMYEAKYPNVTIEPEYASFDDYWKKLAPQAAANRLPDIVQMDISYINQYGSNGQLEDLKPYLNSQIQVGDVNENVLSTGVIGEKQYGIPLGVNVLGFQYDPELLKKAGVDSIPENWTWDQYKEIAAKAKSAGLYMDGSMAADVFFNYYLRTKGLALYNNDGSALGYEDDALFTDFFGMLSGLIKDGAVPSQDKLSQNKGVIEESDIVKGTGIGVWQWSNQYVALQIAVNRPMELAQMPGPDMDKGLYMQPSMYWSITSNSKVKEEAAKFVDFWINDVEANNLIKGERGVPISSKIKESVATQLTDSGKQVFKFVADMEPTTSPMSPPVGSPEVVALLTDLAEQMNFGKIDPAAAAAQFRKEANSILSSR
ncbi:MULTISPECIES: extracellular solute-binding protein [Paenibacillus]|jgi:multiple sugar transport system substrate-binding protein|uniref:extracellular solute-binding protein n=1 Tax=Paenibacillus TaxID=44249 RepID=UPI00096E8482|nr:sugar ABC transporter substrate-binding protein [Paenibacillus odorifer]OMC74979.1 sugar ABC transporter substrate-binding protein [Paenibacillus odorifer]OMD60895.1 sugar ABC transporter substrate-binding protein [Paenibacillus odorifer]OMD71995.1 sugar ABC transporter substrate-binding protein [Paenibacillus odorifer]OMD78717.1 sugar ABC transporter substrate-binding protein [Paenibacillus odorifer]